MCRLLGIYLNELRKRRIRTLLFLELELAIELMSSIADKRPKVRHSVKEDVTNLFNHGKGLLSLVQGVTKLDIDRDDVLNVPEDLLQEVLTS